MILAKLYRAVLIDYLKIRPEADTDEIISFWETQIAPEKVATVEKILKIVLTNFTLTDKNARH